MKKIELTEDTENFPAGYVLSVDDNSAQVLVDRGDATLVDDAPAASVESGGQRARELNQQASADLAERPAKSARVDEWREHAVAQGLATEEEAGELTKAALIELQENADAES